MPSLVRATATPLKSPEPLTTRRKRRRGSACTHRPVSLYPSPAGLCAHVSPAVWPCELRARRLMLTAMSTVALAPPKVPRRSLVTLLCLATLYGVWGSTYLAIRIALTSFPPLEMASLRFFSAGALLYLGLRVRGVAAPTLREWRLPLSHTGALDNAICSCATNSWGRAHNCSTSFWRAPCSRSAPNTGSIPRDGNAGFSTSESR